MCLLCDDEKAYAAYMAYLDAMERQGKNASPDAAVDAVLDAMSAASSKPVADTTLSVHTPNLSPPPSPFSCKPVDDD